MPTSTGFRPALRRLIAGLVLTAGVATTLTAPPATARPTTPPAVPASAPALPPSPPWGACGRSTAEDKVVRQFSNGITLRCGGPLRDPEPRYGYRHIRFRHQVNFQAMALDTGRYRNWRDVADFAAESIAVDPDVTAPARDNQTCLSRMVFLINEETGQKVREQIVVMYIDTATRNIRTLTPRDTQC